MSLTMERTTGSNPASEAVRSGSDLPLRIAGAAALAGTFYVHAIGVSDKLSEVKYLGVGYILLMIGSAVAAAALLVGPARYRRLAWISGAGMAAATIVGFVLTRTTGLPGSSDDIGNWSETAGTLSLVAEGAMVALGAIALPRLRRR